jgi:hypothetical protein
VTEINNAEKKNKKEMNIKSHIFVIVNAKFLILFKAIKKVFNDLNIFLIALNTLFNRLHNALFIA